MNSGIGICTTCTLAIASNVHWKASVGLDYRTVSGQILSRVSAVDTMPSLAARLSVRSPLSSQSINLPIARYGMRIANRSIDANVLPLSSQSALIRVFKRLPCGVPDWRILV